MTVRRKPFRCGQKDMGDSRVIRQREGRKQLRHIADATPFVSGEQPDWESLLV